MLFNLAILQLYHDTRIHFDEMMMLTYSWKLIVLAY
jgi:hypothetical protein